MVGSVVGPAWSLQYDHEQETCLLQCIQSRNLLDVASQLMSKTSLKTIEQ